MVLAKECEEAYHLEELINKDEYNYIRSFLFPIHILINYV